MLRDTLIARLAEMGNAPDYPRLVTEVLGIRGARAELARRLVEQALVVEDRQDKWRRLGARVCEEAPASPAVYVFRDPEGRALYVGKAVNLRRRLRAHFADSRWRALKPAMARAAGVDWQGVGSEIEALWREATLIRDLQPVVNVQVGSPSLRSRAIPRALVHDVVLVVPSIDPDAAELLAARVDGATVLQRTRRNGADLPLLARKLWRFFRPLSRRPSSPGPHAVTPLVFSWLAGRGAGTTRVDPHDSASCADLRVRLATVLKDPQLFAERLVHRWTAPRPAIRDPGAC